MSHYKPYPAYKDSGVEWIGKVPEHWLNMSLKRLAKICNGKDYKEVAEIDGEYPVMGSGGEFARASSYLFNGESVLLGRKGTIDKPLYISGPFWAVDTMFYTEIPKHAFPKFVYYLAMNIPFGRYSTNTALPSMTGEVISSHPIAAPNLNEQKAIANYLDRETTRIDALIAKKTRFVELLKEKRSALITHAVTKGLNPKAKMKDSDVEWIGEVPEHWAVKRLKHLLSEPLKYGANESGDASIEEGPRYIRITDITEDGELRNDSEKRLSPEAAKPYILCDGDILFARSGATVGKTYKYKSEHGPACFAGYLIRARLNRKVIHPDFVTFAVRSHYYWDYIQRTAIQATIENVSAERYGDFPIAVPSGEEQERIIAFVSSSVVRIDTIIAKIQHSIDLLKERRSAFISAAVTGQIDLRRETA